MTTNIHFMNGLYAVERDGEFVAVGSTYHDAEVISASMDEAHHSAIIGGDPLLIEAQRFGERGSICAACEDQNQPCAVCSTEPWRIGRPCPTCGDEGDCPDCGTYTDMDQPLLVQCAAVIDSCLGGPVANGGILDELRRVRAELKKAGV